MLSLGKSSWTSSDSQRVLFPKGWKPLSYPEIHRLWVSSAQKGWDEEPGRHGWGACNVEDKGWPFNTDIPTGDLLYSSGLTCLYLAAQQFHIKLMGGREKSETKLEFSDGQCLACCKWGGNWKIWSFTSLTFCFPSKLSDRVQRLSRLPSHDPQPDWDIQGTAALPSTFSTWQLSHTAA